MSNRGSCFSCCATQCDQPTGRGSINPLTLFKMIKDLESKINLEPTADSCVDTISWSVEVDTSYIGNDKRLIFNFNLNCPLDKNLLVVNLLKTGNFSNNLNVEGIFFTRGQTTVTVTGIYSGGNTSTESSIIPYINDNINFIPKQITEGPVTCVEFTPPDEDKRDLIKAKIEDEVSVLGSIFGKDKEEAKIQGNTSFVFTKEIREDFIQVNPGTKLKMVFVPNPNEDLVYTGSFTTTGNIIDENNTTGSLIFDFNIDPHELVKIQGTIQLVPASINSCIFTGTNPLSNFNINAP